MRRTAALLALAAALAVQPAAAQNLLSNGSFESPTLSSTTMFTTIMNGGSFGAWTVTAGSVDLIRTYWAPADGFQSLDLNGNAPGTIAQTLVTNVGATYALRFSMAGNPDNSLTKVMRVWWGAQDLGLFSFTQGAQTKTAMGWQTILLTGLVGASPSTTLRFQAVSGSATGMALDNVIVTLVPEPAAARLFAAGLFFAILLIVARRHARATARIRRDQ